MKCPNPNCKHPIKKYGKYFLHFDKTKNLNKEKIMCQVRKCCCVSSDWW
ncbi:MAG: hypothetical protein AABY22_30820 [Nanoarchaeota archaeon]